MVGNNFSAQTETEIRRQVYDKCMIHPRKPAEDKEIREHQESRCPWCRGEVEVRLRRRSAGS